MFLHFYQLAGCEVDNLEPVPIINLKQDNITALSLCHIHNHDNPRNNIQGVNLKTSNMYVVQVMFSWSKFCKREWKLLNGET